jgi:hypothetical protein
VGAPQSKVFWAFAVVEVQEPSGEDRKLGMGGVHCEEGSGGEKYLLEGELLAESIGVLALEVARRRRPACWGSEAGIVQ